MSYITIHSPIHSATCRGSYLHLASMASSKQSTATALVLVFLIISFGIPPSLFLLSYVWVYVNDNEKLHRQWFCVVGGKEAEASGCKYLQGPCKTNEECPPACVAKGYTSGALCSIDPSTRATRCCCFVP